MSGIGVLNEKPLHASLREWYAQPGDRFEVAVEGFFIDIVRGDLLIEIQTGNFSSIKPKLYDLARGHRIRLIHPIAQEKWIVKPANDHDGGTTRRKSPRRGRWEDLFREMVSFPKLMADPGFSLEILLIREEEVRRYEGKRRWRSRGWVTVERRLLEVADRRLYEEPANWRSFIPAELDSFTTGDLAEVTGIRRWLAQKMAYCLRETGLIEAAGKRGRSNLYTKTDG